MKEIIFSFFSEIGQKLAILVLVGTTALTAGSAVSKIVADPTKANEARQEQTKDGFPSLLNNNNESSKTEGFVSNNEVNKGDSSPTSPTIKKSVLPVATLTPKPIPTAIAKATQTGASQGATNPSSLCIVTLSGAQYDVTTLRSTHSGGDIFKCGTDMTNSYTSKHGTNLSRMAKYAYSGTAISAPSGSGTSSDNESDDDGDDRDDSENHDRYIDSKDRNDN